MPSFVDEVEITVEAGRGGDGCVSFRREKYVPRGGPDGGDGGDGGSVILRAEPGVDTLLPLAHRKQWKAQSGKPGEGSNRHGRSADDLILRVPPGTVVLDARGGFVMKDLARAGDQVIAAHGGRGGKGNTRFKSATNRAPRESTPGGTGEVRQLRLELKVIADVGLVGRPNAGKSTLLGRLSRARPEVADYPFTTKYPNLGLVSVDDDRSFVMADIPGLIEGAHAGAGLGHEFLRHIERSGILVHLVEPQPIDQTDPVENYLSIRAELEQYSRELSTRPELVVVTKADLPDAREVHARLGAELQRRTDEAANDPSGPAAADSGRGDEPRPSDVLLISAVTGEGLDALVGRIAHLLQLDRQTGW